MCWSKQLFMFSGHFGSVCVCITLFTYVCVYIHVYTWVMYMCMCYIYFIIYIMYKGKALYYISQGDIWMLTLCLLYLVKFKPAFTLLYVVLHNETCNYPQICVPIMFVYLFHKVCYVSRKYRYLFHWTLMSHEIKSTKFDTSFFFF